MRDGAIVEEGLEDDLSKLTIDELFTRGRGDSGLHGTSAEKMREMKGEDGLQRLGEILRHVERSKDTLLRMTEDVSPALGIRYRKNIAALDELLKRISDLIDQKREAVEAPFIAEYGPLSMQEKFAEMVRLYKLNEALKKFYDGTSESDNPPTIEAFKRQLFEQQVRLAVLDHLLEQSGDGIKLPNFRSIRVQRDWLLEQQKKREERERGE